MAAYQEGMNGIQMKPHKLRVSYYDVWVNLKYGSFGLILIFGDIVLVFWDLYDGIFSLNLNFVDILMEIYYFY